MYKTPGEIAEKRYKPIQLLLGDIQANIFAPGGTIFICMLIGRIHIAGNCIIGIRQGIEFAFGYFKLKVVDRPIAGEITTYEKKIDIGNTLNLAVRRLPIVHTALFEAKGPGRTGLHVTDMQKGPGFHSVSFASGLLFHLHFFKKTQCISWRIGRNTFGQYESDSPIRSIGNTAPQVHSMRGYSCGRDKVM